MNSPTLGTSTDMPAGAITETPPSSCAEVRQCDEREAVSTADNHGDGLMGTGSAGGASAEQSPATNPELANAAAAFIMAPLCLSVLLSSLDLTILTPVIPSIVASFHAAEGYVWIGTAFILASTAITPVWGTVADIWGRRPIMLIAMLTFLGGSLLCALAPTMKALIAGRAVQGLGSSGMGTMVNVIICDSFSLRDRGLYMAITSIVWAVGCAVGPVIGGIFSTRLDWRWCFWINLPIGGVVIVVLFFFLKVPVANTPVMDGLKAIDWTGSLLIVGSALMTLLGLEFGDVTYPWSSSAVISLIVFGGAVFALFLLNEWKVAVNPVIPLRLFSNKSSVAGFIVYACSFFILIGLSYYLPLYSESVLGASALGAGIHLIPLIVSSSLAAAFTGAMIQKTGKYLPLLYIGQVMLTLGAGLFLNLEFQGSLAKLFIFEIITGIGIGMNMEPPVLAAQAATSALDTAAVIATMSFMRSIATAVSIVIGGVIFQNRMNDFNAELATHLGTELALKFDGYNAASNVDQVANLSPDQQAAVRQAYYGSFKAVWITYIVVAGVSLLSNLFVRAHHLSSETKSVMLGVNRAGLNGQRPQGSSHGPSIELHRLRD